VSTFCVANKNRVNQAHQCALIFLRNNEEEVCRGVQLKRNKGTARISTRKSRRYVQALWIVDSNHTRQRKSNSIISRTRSEQTKAQVVGTTSNRSKATASAEQQKSVGTNEKHKHILYSYLAIDSSRSPSIIMSSSSPPTGGGDGKKSSSSGTPETKKITINPDLPVPVKRDGVETLAGLSPRMTKKQRSSKTDHKGS